MGIDTVLLKPTGEVAATWSEPFAAVDSSGASGQVRGRDQGHQTSLDSTRSPR